jgi:alkylhydroperoxidase/carboxymuconolactone decarboxylase family protein YurZ
MDEFDKYRAEMNERLLGSNHLGIKRFFALDTQAYEDGALDKRTKELMGLTASIVLRCDDCITYHIKECAAWELLANSFSMRSTWRWWWAARSPSHLRRAIERGGPGVGG